MWLRSFILFLVVTCIGVLSCPPILHDVLGQTKGTDFELTDLEGNQHRLSDYAGKVVVAFFWSSWCAMCKSTFPSLEKLQNEIGEDNLAVLTIGIDDNTDRLKAAARQAGLHFPVLFDSQGEIKKRFAISSIPLGIVFDTHGAIAEVPDPDSGAMVHRIEGPRWWYKRPMLQAIQALLGS